MMFAVLNNILWIILAYLIGSLNFSIILTKLTHKKNIKEVGSGNAGATNAMRAYGIKFGLTVFILDASKSYWFGFALGAIQKNYEAFNSLIPQLILIFVILGHIFPIYFGFKGGKGAATLLGMIASISLFLAIIGAVIFITIVYFTKYVSLGSITVPYILALLAFLCPYFNGIDTTINYTYIWYNPLFLFIASVIVASCHWQNIMRLLSGTESKLSFKNDSKPNNQTSSKEIDTFIKLDKEEKGSTFIDTSTMETKQNINNTTLIDDATTENKFV